MIPKTIHYCWFGSNGSPKPADVQKLIDSWRQVLPDYTFKEWNETNFDVTMCAYSAEAYATRNYAHVSDVCRMHALLTEGGIYLDTDIELLKSFDPYLHHDSFLGLELGDNLGTGVIGAQPGQKWIASFMDYYRTHHFINAVGHEVRTPNPILLTRRVLPPLPKEDWPTVYPFEVFCAKDYTTGEIRATSRTVAIHNFSASWRRHKTIAERARRLLRGLAVRYVRGK